MWIKAFAAGLAVIAVGATGRAQQPQSFNGTWVSTTEAPAGVAAAPSPTMGARFALRIDGQALTLSRPLRDDTLAVTFPLDGSPTSYSIPGRLCEGEAGSTETAAWENGALVLTVVGRTPVGGGATTPLSVKRVFKIGAADTLIVQANIAQQSGEIRPVATVYKRGEAMPAPKAVAAIKGAPATIAQLSWLPGVWIGASGTSTVEERWTPTASGGTIGVSRTLRGAALGSFEFLCIAERQGTLVYQAMPDARFPATAFTLTTITADSATFENPAHDYPKLIRYTRRPDGALETMIAGAAGQRTATVVLQRQQ